METSPKSGSIVNGNADVSSVHNDVGEMEKVWAKELYKLSVEERNAISEDLHGVSVSIQNAVREEGWSAQELHQCVDMFQLEIETNIRPEDKRSYVLGLEMRSSYILSSVFRLGFIRAERYDVKKAAVRYCKCLDFLVQIFGRDALLRPLRLSDLTKNERKFLREGFVQILPSRDRLGRRILVMLGSYGGLNYTVWEKFRVCSLLIFSVLAEDATTQRRGMVSIASFTRGAEEWMKEGAHTIATSMKQFFDAVPLRWTANHLCIPDNPVFHLFRSLALFVNGSRGRKILRIHVGTPLECDYKLISFGIPTDDIPRTHTHSIKLKNHLRLLKIRTTIDSFREQAMAVNGFQNVIFPHIECPEINCVLFGRNAWDHPGNVEFRELIQELVTAQENRDPNEAMPDEYYCINKRLILESMSRNFRFLVYDRQTFVYSEVTLYGDIWKLVDQSMRVHRKRAKAKRMIDEVKAKNGKNNDEKTMKDVSQLSSISSVQSERGGKFTKGCNGCKCLESA